MREQDEDGELDTVDDLLDNIAKEEEQYDRLWKESASKEDDE